MDRSLRNPRVLLVLAAALTAALPLVAIAVLAAPPPKAAAPGPCPVTAAKPCVIDLHGRQAPSASPNCRSEPWSRFVKLVQPKGFSDANRDGWYEAVLEITLDPAKNCGCATFRISFDAPPDGFTVNIGDSPTNDGYGGDAGTTLDAAEMQILGSHLSVFTSGRPRGGTSPIELLYEGDLPPLAGRSIDFEVCDQTLGFTLPAGKGNPEPLRWRLQTLNLGLLYSLSPAPAPGKSEDKPAPGNNQIYAAFNRVIHNKAGAASHNRLGSGVKRVEITLSP
jgi:hypothetical protein